MLSMARVLCIAFSFFFLASACVTTPLLQAQGVASRRAEQASAEQPLPLVPSRKVSFTAREGTWVSLDVSPDGQNVIFDLLGHLYVMSIHGGQAQAITHGLSFNQQPRYSPDGKQIVFVSDRSGGENVWISRPDGSDARQITSEEQNMIVSPAWTADGKYILVSRRSPRYHDSAFELWMYDIRGGSGVRLTRSKLTPDPLPTNLQNSLGAAASRDGKYIYYARKAGEFAVDVKLPLWQVARRDTHSGEETVITGASGSGMRPVLSPDGKYLVYATRYGANTGLRIRDLANDDDHWLKFPVQRDDQESLIPTHDIFPGYAFTPDSKSLVLAYGGKIHRIDLATKTDEALEFTADVEREIGPDLNQHFRVDQGPVEARLIQAPAESPDGQRIVFSALTHLYLADRNNPSPKRVTAGDLPEYEPSWSPDGNSIAYVTWSNGEGILWKIAANGSGKPVRLTTEPGYYSQPTWSPDGSQIVVLRTPRVRVLEQAAGGGGRASDLVAISASGKSASVLVSGQRYTHPHFAGNPARLYVDSLLTTRLGEGEHQFISMKPDGSDRQVVFTVTGKNIWGPDYSPAIQMMASPDASQALITFRNQVYLFNIPARGDQPPAINITSPTESIQRLTTTGADFVGWADHGKTLTWSLASTYFRLPLDAVASGVAAASAGGRGAGSQTNTFAAAKSIHPSELKIVVTVPRDIEHGLLVLTNAKVITMHGDLIYPKGDVVIRDNRIAAVGPSGEVAVPAGAKVLDMAGKVILPGYIDVHAHWSDSAKGILDLQNQDFLASLAFGITAGRDPQTSTIDMFAYQDLVDAGSMRGPRAYSTGPGVFWTTDFHSEEEAEEAIRRYKEYYRTNLLKSYMVGDRRQREYVVEACLKLHVMPTTEGGADMPMDLTHVIDGFSGNEHRFPIADLYQDVTDFVSRAGIFYTPTLILSEYGDPGSSNFYLTTTDVANNPKLKRFLPQSALDRRTTRFTYYRPDEYIYQRAAASADRLAKKGVKVAVGGHGMLQGMSFHWELWTLQSGGMSNLEALRSATLRGAEVMGLEQDLGSIEAGKLADLVVLNKDPLQDITNSTSIEYVLQNGQLLNGDSLDEVYPVQKKAGPFWWWDDQPTR